MHAMTLDDVFDLENRVATVQATCLGFGCERNDAPIVVGEHTDGLAFKSRMKDLLDRAEE